MRTVMILLGAFVGASLLFTWMIAWGEIVMLVTWDAEQEVATPLWIVSVEGDSYLRATNADAAWLVRMKKAPPGAARVGNVALREGSTAVHVDVPWLATQEDDAGIRARVDEAMAEKYGLAFRVWSWIEGEPEGESVPVRLDPVALPPTHSGSSS